VRMYLLQCVHARVHMPLCVHVRVWLGGYVLGPGSLQSDKRQE
jgi:hypothetical protein